MRAQVGRRDHAGADGRRGQVDGADAGLGIARGRIAVHVGAGRLEHQVRLLALGEQPIDALVRGLQAQLPGTCQTFGLRIDTDHPARLEPLRPQQLVQQVGADVARPDNGN